MAVEPGVWQAVGALGVAVVSAVGGYLTARRSAQTAERPIERDLQAMAREMIDDAVKGLREDMKTLKDEHKKEVEKLSKDRERDQRNIKTLSNKWGEIQGGLLKLRAAFEANDLHLSTYLGLIKNNPAAAQKYLKNLLADRERLTLILTDLCETSEPQLEDGDGDT